MNKKKKSRGES